MSETGAVLQADGCIFIELLSALSKLKVCFGKVGGNILAFIFNDYCRIGENGPTQNKATFWGRSTVNGHLQMLAD